MAQMTPEVSKLLEKRFRFPLTNRKRWQIP
jgi:hypothetical protein